MEIINLTNTKREWNHEWLEISPIFCSPTFSKLIFQIYHLCHLSQASWSLVLNKRSVIYVYTCEQQGQQRISQMSYSQSCACLICDFNLEKMSIKKLIKTLSGSIHFHDSMSIWWTSKSKLPMITCHSCQLHLPYSLRIFSELTGTWEIWIPREMFMFANPYI